MMDVRTELSLLVAMGGDRSVEWRYVSEFASLSDQKSQWVEIGPSSGGRGNTTRIGTFFTKSQWVEIGPSVSIRAPQDEDSVSGRIPAPPFFGVLPPP